MEPVENIYLNNGQPAQIGDLVRVARTGKYRVDSGINGKEAVVDMTYFSKFGHGNPHSLGLKFKDNHICWFNANELEFIKADQLHLIDDWKKRDALRKKREQSYNFIVKWAMNHPTESLPRYSVLFLWRQFANGRSIWGNNGEGMTAFLNQLMVIQAYTSIRKGFGKPITKRNSKEFRKYLVHYINLMASSVVRADGTK